MSDRPGAEGSAATTTWSVPVRAALRSAGRGQDWLAHELRKPPQGTPVSTRMLQYWLNDSRHEPPRWAVSQIAGLLELDEGQLYSDLGWLDAHTALVKRDGVQVAVKTIQLLRGLSPNDGSGAQAVLARALDLGHEAFTWRRFDDFTQHPLRQYIGISHPRSPDRARTGNPRDHRLAEITEQYAQALRQAPGLVEDRPPELDEARARHRSEIWFWVPLVVRTRAPQPASGRFQLSLLAYRFDVVLLVGGRGAGADRIGAWLAEDAGLGYINTSLEAQRIYGRSFTGDGGALVDHARHSLWTGLACTTTAVGDGYVISHGSPNTAAELVDALGTTRGKRVLIVHCAASNSVIDYASSAFVADIDSPEDDGRAQRRQHANLKAAVGRVEQLDRSSPLALDSPSRISVLHVPVDFARGHERLPGSPRDLGDLEARPGHVRMLASHHVAYLELVERLERLLAMPERA